MIVWSGVCEDRAGIVGFYLALSMLCWHLMLLMSRNRNKSGSVEVGEEGDPCAFCLRYFINSARFADQCAVHEARQFHSVLCIQDRCCAQGVSSKSSIINLTSSVAPHSFCGSGAHDLRGYWNMDIMVQYDIRSQVILSDVIVGEAGQTLSMKCDQIGH